jgi:hypothetical protein
MPDHWLLPILDGADAGTNPAPFAVESGAIFAAAGAAA